MTSARVSGPAGVLVVDHGGRGGLPVVFAHSLAGNSSQWKAQLEHLRPNRDRYGHWIQLDKPEEFNRIMDEFLEQVSQP